MGDGTPIMGWDPNNGGWDPNNGFWDPKNGGWDPKIWTRNPTLGNGMATVTCATCDL